MQALSGLSIVKLELRFAAIGFYGFGDGSGPGEGLVERMGAVHLKCGSLNGLKLRDDQLKCCVSKIRLPRVMIRPCRHHRVRPYHRSASARPWCSSGMNPLLLRCASVCRSIPAPWCHQRFDRRCCRNFHIRIPVFLP